MEGALNQLAQAQARIDEQLQNMGQRTEEFRKDGARLQETMSGEFQKISQVQEDNAGRQHAAQEHLAQNTEGVV